MKIGFTTVTFRGKTIEENIDMALQSGASGIEWGGDVHVAPGNFVQAEKAARLTREAGLQVYSYGSYYRTDSEDPSDFLPVLETARRLGTALVRVWAGTLSPEKADKEYRERVVRCAREIGKMAKDRQITVAFEYHRNTLTENAVSAVALLEEIGLDNVKSYWQPNPDLSHQENMAELKAVLPYLVSVHMFYWTGANVRHLFKEGMDQWQDYLSVIHHKDDINFLLEFCKDDADTCFLADMDAIRSLLLPKAVFLTTQGSQHQLDYVFAPAVRSRLCRSVTFLDRPVTPEDLEENRESLAQVRYAFSTWGMASLTGSQIQKYLPQLEAVFYAAGSVQYFARPFLEQGIAVHSAWGANGVPVAEYAVAQILLANKGFYQSLRLFKEQGRACAHQYATSFPGNYRVKVGILGAGMIGSMVCNLLKGYQVEVLIYDLFASDEKLAYLGAKRATLEEIFSQCQTISNHIANNPQTVGMLDYRLFSQMKPTAVFINTGRGAQVVEDDLVRALQEEPGRTAVLDVTYPEPPVDGHPFYTMPNVLLTPHIAGSFGNEVERMGEYMALECEKKIAGIPCQYEVTMAMLETMA